MRAVQRSRELARILALPRRTGDVTDLIDPLSAFLRKAHVCGPNCAGGFTRLNLLQTQALVEFHDTGGLFLQAPLGAGKTGIAVLAPTLLNLKRALYVVPGAAIKSGKVQEEIRVLSEHWRIVPFGVVSYQKLTREAQEFFFFEPPGPYDGFIFDEAHFAKNEDKSIAKRISRLIDNAGREVTLTNSLGRSVTVQVPAKTPLAIMTATPVKDSLNNCAHHMSWALGEHCPVPRVKSEIDDWAGALDADPAERVQPGALVAFSGGRDDIESVRKGIAKWMFDTPGCISSSDTYVDARLEINLRNVALKRSEDEWFRVLRGDPNDPENFPGWTTPSGDIFTDAAELWRHACSMALGYFTEWDPRAPRDWRLARYEWHAAVREILQGSRTLDTNAQVATAVDNGRYPELEQILKDWREIEPTFKPNTVPVWVGDTALNYARAWLEGGGIVWSQHTFFGRKLAELAGVPYFGQGGTTDDGQQSIVHTKARAIVASVGANGSGQNLQRYDRNLIASVWPVGYTVEQLIGRTHRQGQRSPLVTVDWMISCREQLNGYTRAATSHGPFMRDLFNVPSRLCGAAVRSEKIVTSGWAFHEQGIDGARRGGV